MSVYDHYEIHQLLGHGCSCTVRKAIRKDSREVYAAKIYETDFIKAKNEVDMLVRLDHPNIVNIFEIYEEGDFSIILILQYMQGGELYDSVSQKIKFTEGQVKNYIRILMDSVRYCHQVGIVHRDIKPENLLLSTNKPDGILKLADFGISKILSDEMLTTNCGTPIYMAPEIWRGESYTQKVDLWSIGIAMYYLLSGEHPFNGDDSVIGQKIMENALEFSNDSWKQISSKAISLIKMLLEKNAEKRPSAQQAMGHIWFSEEDLPAVLTPTSTEQQQKQINLYKSVNKIRRFICKDKEKRSRKKIQRLMKAEDLPRERLKFLIYEETTEEMTIQKESQFNDIEEQF